MTYDEKKNVSAAFYLITRAADLNGGDDTTAQVAELLTEASAELAELLDSDDEN